MAWYRSADYGISTSIASPMFRNIKIGYRESSGLRTTYDEEYAIETDRLMAKLLRIGDFSLIYYGYISPAPSRVAARQMTNNVRDRMGDKFGDKHDFIAHTEYLRRLEVVVARVDSALLLITSLDAEGPTAK